MDAAVPETSKLDHKSNTGSACLGGFSGNDRKMPFGRPVVPDE